jgi:hypothetical protein
MYGLRAKKIIDGATITKATHWLLTVSGLAVDTQTITIGGVVFTTVALIGTTAGNVLMGANQAATLANLVTLINAPETTTTTGVALSAADANTIRNILGLTASTTATVMTLTSSKNATITVSETETNFAWSSYYLSEPIAMGAGYGKTSLQFVASAISSGNGVLSVEVSNDNTNWVVYNRLNSNVTNTNAQTDTRVASLTLSTNTSGVVTFPNDDAFSALRVKVVPTTDGTYSVIALVA